MSDNPGFCQVASQTEGGLDCFCRVLSKADRLWQRSGLLLSLSGRSQPESNERSAAINQGIEFHKSLRRYSFGYAVALLRSIRAPNRLGEN